MTPTYISHDFSTVHISKDFSLRNQSGKKCRRTKRYCMQKNTLDWRKIKMINATLRIQPIIHLTRLDCSSFCTWFGKFSGMMEKHTLENRKAGKVQRTKPKKQRAEDISQKLTSLFLGDPCRTACSVGLTTRSSVAGGL